MVLNAEQMVSEVFIKELIIKDECKANVLPKFGLKLVSKLSFYDRISHRKFGI